MTDRTAAKPDVFQIFLGTDNAGAGTAGPSLASIRLNLEGVGIPLGNNLQDGPKTYGTKKTHDVVDGVLVVEQQDAVAWQAFLADQAANNGRPIAPGEDMPVTQLRRHHPGDADDSLDLILPAVEFYGVRTNADGEGKAENEIPFRAHYAASPWDANEDVNWYQGLTQA